MFRKLITVLFFLTAMMKSLVGCSLELIPGFVKEYEDNIDGFKNELHEWEDGIKCEFDDGLGSISQYSLTGDKRLKGERELVVDDYAGNYDAEYNRFNGEEHIIAEVTAEGVYEITLSAGDNFIVLRGDDFTGTLAVTVE